MTTRLDSRPVLPAENISELLSAHLALLDAHEARDQAILRAVAAGGSLREVAACVGLTHAGVRDVIRRKA